MEDRIRKPRSQKFGMLRIAKEVGCGVSVVQRVLAAGCGLGRSLAPGTAARMMSARERGFHAALPRHALCHVARPPRGSAAYDVSGRTLRLAVRGLHATDAA